MERFMLRFEEIRKEDIAAAGGKGANLGEMTNAGIPVPPGAVLTAAAYDRFMDFNGIIPEQMLNGAESESSAAEQIRNAIRKGTLPDEIQEELSAFYQTLGGNARVAVRSSATAEDLEDASFAGQQETYLNVIGIDMLLQKVRECYASLWGDRAVSYRKTQGYDRQKVALAVVIQQMIQSETAGVMFTRNPASGTDDILINASYGLGEAVVSGIVSPDEYTCGRDGNLKKAVIGSKEVQIVYDEKGTKKESVPAELRNKQALDAGMIAELVREGLKIESHYGHPMDIEWAVNGGRIYILQARSITAAADMAEHSFTEADFAGLPQPRPANGRMRESVLFNLEKLPRPYFPLDHDFGDAVGKQKQVIFSEIGIDMNEMTPINSDGISSFAIGGFKPTRKIFRLPGAAKQMLDTDGNVRISSEKLAECQNRLDAEKQLACSGLSQIGESLSRMQKLISDTAYARFRYAIFPQVILNRGLDRTLKKAAAELNSFDLLEGLSYVTANVNRDMDQLARLIRNQPEVRHAVMVQPYAEVCREFPQLSKEFASFMEKYGCRSDFNCYCFTSKSWNDDPDRFLESLRTMLRSENTRILTLAESRQKFDTLMEKLRGAVGSKGWDKFEKKVKAVRHFHQIREATQYLWECEFAHCRVLLRKAAALLNADYSDLLYLFADELFSVCRSGKLDPAMRALIDQRKAKRPLAEAYWDYSISVMLASDGNDIHGISGSSGQAAGKVRIIQNQSEFSKLQKGEILVCPYTDPEWTPLFTLAAAVVVDTGGTLSHAAIVAREYKIPAVLATGNATAKLKDGDTVIVNGTAGTVTIA